MKSYNSRGERVQAYVEFMGIINPESMEAALK